jgi:hypothetical protein
MRTTFQEYNRMLRYVPSITIWSWTGLDPPQLEENMTTREVRVRLDDETVTILDSVKSAFGTSYAETVRRAVKAYTTVLRNARYGEPGDAE